MTSNESEIAKCFAETFQENNEACGGAMIETVTLGGDWLLDPSRARCSADGRLMNYLSLLNNDLNIKSIKDASLIPLGLQLYTKKGDSSENAEDDADDYFFDRSSQDFVRNEVQVELLIINSAANFVRNTFFSEIETRRNFFSPSAEPNGLSSSMCVNFMFDALQKSAVWVQYCEHRDTALDTTSTIDKRDDWQTLRHDVSNSSLFEILDKLHCCVTDRLDNLFIEARANYITRTSSSRSLVIEKMTPIQVSLGIY
jgi:hypothetical protein